MKKIGFVLLIMIFAMSIFTFTACEFLTGTSDTKFTVTFDTNNGSQATTVTVAKDHKVSRPANPIREGFDFIDWYAGFSNTPFDFNKGINADITLTARWSSHFTDAIGNLQLDNITVDLSTSLSGVVDGDPGSSSFEARVKLADGMFYIEYDEFQGVIKDDCHYSHEFFDGEWYYFAGYNGIYGGESDSEYAMLQMIIDLLTGDEIDLNGLGLENLNSLPWVVTKQDTNHVYTYELDFAPVYKAAVTALKNGITQNQKIFDFIAAFSNGVGGALGYTDTYTGAQIKQDLLDFGNTKIGTIIEQLEGFNTVLSVLTGLYAPDTAISNILGMVEEYKDKTVAEFVNTMLEMVPSEYLPFSPSYETIISMISDIKVNDLIILMFNSMEEEFDTSEILEYLDIIDVNKYSTKIVIKLNADNELISIEMNIDVDIDYDGEKFMDIIGEISLEFSGHGTTIIDYDFDQPHQIDSYMGFILKYGEAYEMEFNNFGYTFEIDDMYFYCYGEFDYDAAEEFLLANITIEGSELKITKAAIDFMEEYGIYIVNIICSYYFEGSTAPDFDNWVFFHIFEY